MTTVDYTSLIWFLCKEAIMMLFDGQTSGVINSRRWILCQFVDIADKEWERLSELSETYAYLKLWRWKRRFFLEILYFPIESLFTSLRCYPLLPSPFFTRSSLRYLLPKTKSFPRIGWRFCGYFKILQRFIGCKKIYSFSFRICEPFSLFLVFYQCLNF